jgi:hypothetical protein
MEAQMRTRLLLATIATLALAGCAGNPAAGGSGDTGTVDIRGEWTLLSGSDADGTFELPDFPVTMVFTDGSARVRTGCYSFDSPMTGDIDVQTAAFVTTEVSSPQASCMGLTPDLDTATTSLDEVTDVARDGDSLVLSGDALELSFELVPAVASADLDGSWTLDSIRMSDTAQAFDTGPTITIQDGKVSALLGCDNLTGTITPVSGNNVVDDLVVEPAADVCALMLDNAAEQVKTVLSEDFLIHRDGDTLDLVSSTDDSTLVFMPSV